jgi:hypothetical protein
MIRAECHSDDYVYEVNFDATKWFQEATDQEIRDLAGCEWGGDYPADAVAQYFEDTNAEIGAMFDYLYRVRNQRDAPGFEVHVEEEDATRWLAENRPNLLRNG